MIVRWLKNSDDFKTDAKIIGVLIPIICSFLLITTILNLENMRSNYWYAFGLTLLILAIVPVGRFFKMDPQFKSQIHKTSLSPLESVEL
jgi:predicted tellurium resistance membrane protein TerC